MHVVAATCFFSAFLFYLFAWTNVAFGLAIFGVLFEITAWIIWLATDKKKKCQ